MIAFAEMARDEGRRAGAEAVLLVEDDPLVLLATSELMADAGFEVLEAASTAAAVRRLEERPDIATVITDISMPGASNGIALAWIVAERWPHARIVIVSGAERPPAADYPAKAVFFTKPYAPGALIAMAREPA